MSQDSVFQFMIEMSQKHFGEYWVNGLEYILWHECFDYNASRCNLEPYERHHLAQLAESCNRWWINDEGMQFRSVSLAEFTLMYLSEFGDML